MTPDLHLWLIPLLPLLGAALNGLFGGRWPRRAVALVGTVFVGAAFAWTLWVASQFRHLTQVPHIEEHLPWIAAGGFVANFGFYLDQLSLVMALVVTGVGFLIHIYSIGYMEHEGGYYRFFAYLNLFMFFMLTLVLADNYLLMFVGWEGVGLASYLLIGFWFRKDSASAAGKKAFIVNRIGDFGFLIALFLLIKHFGSLNFAEVFPAVSHLGVEAAPGLLTAIALLLMLGACGKSAQLPLYVWLPDAMEGPTPVSALIHAATMVTAGVYMVARSNLIFSRAPEALTVVAVVGCLTALFAATIGMAQTDIKRVLAYSTISQLGYMFLACGVAAYSAAIFHLMTHAFFKALLFLAAGSVIHALGGEQDMRNMGGLRKHIPWTFWTMTAATFAIAGTPFFSGFYSKDEILWKAWSSPYGSWIFWAVGVATAGLTSFYMFRLWFLTFFGESRGPEDRHPHESPSMMLGPLVILAFLSVTGGWIGAEPFEHFLAPATESQQMIPGAQVQLHNGTKVPFYEMEELAPRSEPAELPSSQTEQILTGVSVGAAALGLFFAWLLYYKRRDLPQKAAAALGGLYTAVANKYYVDEGYNAVVVQPLVEGSTRLLWRGVDAGLIDGTVNQAAGDVRQVSDTLRHMQSGSVRSYAGWVAAGAAAVLAYLMWVGAR